MKTNVNIYDFKDPILFLEACYQEVLETDKEFSVRKWAKVIGFDSTDTLIKILGRKKALSSALVETIALGLELDSTETSFFTFMVKSVQSKDVYEKNIYETVLKEISGSRGTRVFIGDEDIFLNWENLAILSFCNLKTKCSRENLKSLFIDDVSQDVIDQGVEKLLRVGLLREDEDGFLHRLYNHESTRNDHPMASVRGYYRQVFDLAIKKIELPVEEREFQTSLLAIREDQLPVMKDLIRNFKAKLATLCETNEGEVVYHLNVQFFPVSKNTNEILGKVSNANLRDSEARSE